VTPLPQSWIQHVFRSSGWNPREQTRIILWLSGALVLLAGIIYVLQISSVAHKRHALDELLSYRDSLYREVNLLRAEITARENLAELQQRAEALGFQHASREEIRYLQVPQVSHHTTETASKTGEEEALLIISSDPREMQDSSWWAGFQRQWQEFAQP